MRSERRHLSVHDALSCGNRRTTDIRAFIGACVTTSWRAVNTAAQSRRSGARAPGVPRARRAGCRPVRTARTPEVICITTRIVEFGGRPAERNYAWRMTGWRDERVLAAEEALRAAVRTADDILARDEPPQPEPEPEPAHRPVLRDAW